MPDLKISELPAATAPTGVELIEIVQGGVNKQTTTQDIANLGGGGGGSITSVNGDTGPAVTLDAADIPNTPAGTIAATTVQAAINELDTEKAPIASPTFTGTPAAPTAAVGTNTTQVATTAFVQQESIVDYNNEGAIGQVLNMLGTSIPSHTDISGAANFSVVSSKLRYAPSGTTPLTTLNIIDNPFKNGEVEIKFTVAPVTGIGAGTLGFRIGLYSTSPYSGTTLGDISGGIRTTTTNPGSAYVSYVDQLGALQTSAAISGDNLALSTGDDVTLIYTFRHWGHQVKIIKTSNGRTTSHTGVFNSFDNSLGVVPPTWKLFIAGEGGEYDIEFIKVRILDKAQNDVLMIGDSITARSIASSFEKVWSFRIKDSVRNASVLGFPAFTSDDILPYIDDIIATQTNKPVVILLIGANDARGTGGATPTTWRTDFDAIVDLFIAAGWTNSNIIVCKLLPQASGADNTAVNTINGHIDTDYTTYEKVELNALLNVGGVATTLNFNADLLHPNDRGHALIYRLVMQSLMTRSDIGITKRTPSPVEQLYLEGTYSSFVPTVGASQFSANPTFDATYYKNGSFAHLQISTPGSGTSNGTAFTITNLPSIISPRRSVNVPVLVQNNSVIVTGRMDVGGGGTTITFYTTPAAAAFTASGNKACYVSVVWEV